MSTVISVEGVSKAYRLGTITRRTLRDDVSRLIARLRGQPDPFLKLPGRDNTRTRGSTFWALRDVNFDVKDGEVVGIIGQNGAGKSTLLKILSRVTCPTEGRIRIKGRVASLLEVGTGFHPELTGRENVFLNGAILGMSQQEIRRKFDEIVAFAEIDEFIDTPVKRYSSGMYVRLAFAVAAHLEPEILVVDEVLAVGDAQFQRKCIGKIGSVARAGRTVLVVSHNMGIIHGLCSTAVFLRNGQVRIQGTVQDVVAEYLNVRESSDGEDLGKRLDREGRGDVRLTRVEVTTTGGSEVLHTGQPARFVFHLSKPARNLACTFSIYDHMGQGVATCSNVQAGPNDGIDPDLGARMVCDLEELLLVKGHYTLNVLIQSGAEIQDRIEGVGRFAVEPGLLRGRAVFQQQRSRICLPQRWLVPG